MDGAIASVQSGQRRSGEEAAMESVLYLTARLRFVIDDRESLRRQFPLVLLMLGLQ